MDKLFVKFRYNVDFEILVPIAAIVQVAVADTYANITVKSGDADWSLDFSVTPEEARRVMGVLAVYTV